MLVYDQIENLFDENLRKNIQKHTSKNPQKPLFSNNKKMVLVNPGSTNRNVFYMTKYKTFWWEPTEKHSKNPQFSNNNQMVLVKPVI